MGCINWIKRKKGRKQLLPTFKNCAKETVSCCASETALALSMSATWRTESSTVSSRLISAVSLRCKDPGDMRLPVVCWAGFINTGRCTDSLSSEREKLWC